MRSSVQLSVLGVDVGGTAVKWAVISDGSVRETGSTDTPTSPDTDLVAMIAALVSRLGGTGPVGVALPGPVPWAGLLPFTPNLPGVWRSSEPAHDLAVSTGREVRLLNDAHAFVIGEAAFGALGGVDDAVALTLGTGVGGAVLLDGALHRGVRGRAGEFGHMCVDPDGPPCVCGDNGCLEVFASASAIRAAARLLGAGVSGAGAFLDPVPEVAELARLTGAGDAALAAVFDAAGAAIGTALSAASAAYAPEVIVIGGGVSAALPLMRPRIEAALRRRAGLLAPAPVVASELGAVAGAIGAAVWAASPADDPPKPGVA